MSKNIKQTALKEILYGAGISFILGMIGYVFMFLFKLIAARYFGPADFGIYEMVNTLLGVVFIFSSLGLSQGIQRFIPYYIEKNRLKLLKGYIVFTNWAAILLGFFFWFVLFILSNQITSFFNFPIEFSLYLKIVSISIPFKNIAKITANRLLAEKKAFMGSFGYNVIERVSLLMGILTIVLFKLSLIWLVVFLTFSFVANFCITLFFYNKLSKIRVVPKYKVKEWMKYSLPLMFTGILAYFLSWTDNFVIGRFLIEQELGFYSVAYSLANYILFLPSIFLALFLPVMTSLFLKDRKIFNETFRHVLKWIFTTTCFLGLLFILFSKEIIRILFGLDYVSASLSFSILTFFFILVSIFNLSHIVLMITKDTNFLFINPLIFSFFNLILNIFLVQSYGIEGAAFASGLSLLLVNFSEFIRSRKSVIINDSKQALMYLKIFLSSFFIVLFVKGLFTFILNNLSINLYLKLIIALSFYILLSFFSIVKLGILNQEDIGLLLIIEKRLRVNLVFFKKIIKKSL